jgi:hypothetical protein
MVGRGRSAARAVLCAAIGVTLALPAAPARAGGPAVASDITASPEAEEDAGVEDAEVEDAGVEDAEDEGLDDEERRKAEALAAFQEARRLYLEGEYSAAAAEFRRSYDTLPSLEALVASARAYAKGGELFAAIAAYEEYLEFEDHDATRHDEALRHLRELRGRIAEVVLRIEAPEVVEELRLNGEVVDLEDFPRRILPGTIRLEIREAGSAEPRTITSEVRGGEKAVIDVPRRPPEPPPVVGPPVEPPEIAEPEPPPRGLKVALFTGVGLTGAAALTVAALGGVTLRQRRIYADALCTIGEDGSCVEGSFYPHDEEARFYELRRATNVLVGVTAGVAVVTLAIGLALRRASLRAKGAGKAGATGRRQVRVDWRVGGVALRF